MAGADHSGTISVTIILAALPPSRQGFGTALFLVDKATNTLNGSRTWRPGSATDVATYLAAGYISATTAAQLTTGFAQIPTPSVILVANHDTAAVETLAAALAAIEAVDTDWYGSAIYSRLAADIAAWALLIETRKKLFVAQSADASWLDSGVPAGLSAIAAYERTAVIFHDTATVAADLAWLVSRLVYDPDNQSAGWTGRLRSVAALATALTAAQLAFLIANDANVGLPFSSAGVYVDPGVTMASRGVYVIVTADWYSARIAEDVALLRLDYSDRGAKIPVSTTGQALILSILNKRLQQGVAAGHFLPGQIRPTAYAISAADLVARRLRFKVEAQIAGDARLFTFTIYVQETELQAA